MSQKSTPTDTGQEVGLNVCIIDTTIRCHCVNSFLLDRLMRYESVYMSGMVRHHG